MGVRTAALSMSPAMELYSWQEPSSIYGMILDVEGIGKDRPNSVNLPDPTLNTELRGELAELFTKPMGWPSDQKEQELFATDADDLAECPGLHGTIIYFVAPCPSRYSPGQQCHEPDTENGEHERPAQVNAGCPHGPHVFAPKDQVDDLARERRERRQPAHEAGNDEQPRLRRKMRVPLEVRDGHANQKAANVVGGQRTERQRRINGVKRSPRNQRNQAPAAAPIPTAAILYGSMTFL